MTVILGEEIANSQSLYDSRFGKVRKWWLCPRCNQEFLFKFNGNPPWPPPDLECPSCGRKSPIPWSAPPMVTWKCERCGRIQQVSSRAWKSRDKKYTEVDFWGIAGKTSLFCEVCFGDIPGGYGQPATLSEVAKQTALGALEFACELIGDLTGWNQEDYAHQCEEIEKDTKKFDQFLRKVPQIRAEQSRLAEKERKMIELEAKKRQEEMRLLNRQARTSAGLKRMKPINFEFAVASLYLKLGYKVYATPASGDQGIDLIALKDKQQIAIQCKRYKRKVPVSQVRDFYGSFVGIYNRGVFVTSSVFSKATREWAEEREGLELLNGQQLAKLFIEHDPKIVRNVEKWKEHPLGRD